MRRHPKQRKNRSPKVSEQEVQELARAMGVRILTMTVTFGPKKDPSVPEEVDKQMQELWDLVHEEPEEAVPRLEELSQRYPQVPQLRNYLAASLQNLEEFDRLEELIEEDFHRFPTYSFAKAAYGTMLLKKGRIKEFERLFPLPIHPRAWHPDTETFHVTEVVAVLVLAALYDVKRQAFSQAMEMIEELEKLDPNGALIADVKSELATALMKSRVLRKGWRA